MNEIAISADNILVAATPASWTSAAIDNIEILLIDHAHCEKKAASTALAMLFRYVSHAELLNCLSRLAREELRHFEQVTRILQARGIVYRHLTPPRYAGSLRAAVRHDEPGRLVDLLLCSALVEARSCERFDCLAPVLDKELGRFYAQLYKAESRHAQEYVRLARLYGGNEADERLGFLSAIEAELATLPDEHFRFHSGPPQ